MVSSSFVDEYDLTPCYTVDAGVDDAAAATCHVIRCRRCSAAWLPSKTDNAGLAPLLRHARKRHKIKLAKRYHLPPQNPGAPPYIAGMPIQVPPDAKLVTDQRLTLIRVISTLNDKLVEGDEGLKAKVKESMRDKGAAFAESKFVVAALRAGGAKGTIDATKLYALVQAKKLTLAQFLECVTVEKTPLKKYLGGDQVEKLTTFGPASAPSLSTEFKVGVELDLERLAEQLVGGLAQAVPIKAA